MYLSHQSGIVDAEFKHHFGISFRYFWLGWVVGFDKKIMIDIGKFDDYLIEKYNYTGSMSDFIMKEFGEKAHKLILNLL